MEFRLMASFIEWVEGNRTFFRGDIWCSKLASKEVYLNSYVIEANKDRLIVDRVKIGDDMFYRIVEFGHEN